MTNIKELKRGQQSVFGIRDGDGAGVLAKANQRFKSGLLLDFELGGVDRWEARGGRC